MQRSALEGVEICSIVSDHSNCVPPDPPLIQDLLEGFGNGFEGVGALKSPAGNSKVLTGEVSL